MKLVKTTSPVCRYESHPVRVRGLKRTNDEMTRLWIVWSHPVRVRGLKPGIILELFGRAEVAPRAGAWVETIKK